MTHSWPFDVLPGTEYGRRDDAADQRLVGTWEVPGDLPHQPLNGPEIEFFLDQIIKILINLQ